MPHAYDKPDSGYSWAILVAGFLLQILFSSSFGTLGILLVEYLQYFQLDKTVTSGIGATLLATFGIMGFVVGPLIQYFGYRRIVQVGTVLVVCGMGFSAMASNIYVIYITHGFIAGSGFSCWVVSSSLVQKFFVKRRALSTACMMAGLSCGLMFWSPLMQWLISAYTYKGALIIIAGLNLNGFVVGAVFREPRIKPRDGAVSLMANGKKCIAVISESGKGSDVAEMPNDIHDEDEHEPQKDYHHHATPGLENVQRFRGNMYSNDGSIILNEGAIENGCLDHHRMVTMHESKHCPKQKQISILSVMCDFSVFRIPALRVFYVSVILALMGNFVPVSFMPLRVVTMGVAKEKAALVVTALGVGSGVGSVFFGWVGDQPWADRKFMFAASNVLTGLVSISSAFMYDYNALVAYCIAFAVLSSCYVSSQPVVVGDLVGMEKLAVATGYAISFLGVAQLVSISLSGYLIDQTGDAGTPFLVFGAVQAVGGVVAFGVYWMARKGVKGKTGSQQLAQLGE